MSQATAKPYVDSLSVEHKTVDPDFELVQQVQAGDTEAFDKLVVRYRQRLYSVIYNMTSNREDAADLTQEAFIKAFSSIKRFKGQSSFYTWIYRIAVNTTLSHLKRNRFKQFFSFDDISEEAQGSEIVERLASNQHTDRTALLNELQEKLNEAIQKLSLKHRTVVILHEIEGLNHEQIAEITKTTTGTVRSRLHYAKQLLQSSLQDYIK